MKTYKSKQIYPLHLDGGRLGSTISAADWEKFKTKCYDVHGITAAEALRRFVLQVIKNDND